MDQPIVPTPTTTPTPPPLPTSPSTVAPQTTLPVNPIQVPPVAQPECPVCHSVIKISDYYCYNCGKALRVAPKSVSLTSIILYSIASLVLPPMGILWGIRFIRDGQPRSKALGISLIILTIVELIVLTISTIQLVNTVNEQVNVQLQNLQGF